MRKIAGVAADGLSGTARWIGVLALVALTLNVVMDVLLRAFAGSGIPKTTDMVAHWWMVGLAFAGLALAEQRGEHIMVDGLIGLAPEGVRKWVVRFSDAILVAVLAILFWFSLLKCMEDTQFGARTVATQLPIWPAEWLIPVSFLAFLIIKLRMMFTGQDANRGAS